MLNLMYVIARFKVLNSTAQGHHGGTSGQKTLVWFTIYSLGIDQTVGVVGKIGRGEVQGHVTPRLSPTAGHLVPRNDVTSGAVE